MAAENVPAVAGGDIRVCRFIKGSTATAYRVLEADANERTIGITKENAKLTPLPGASALHAEELDPVYYWTEGEIALLEAGSGGWTLHAELKSDADGKGVAAATTGATKQLVGAIALEAAAEGEFGKVLVKQYPHYPALA